MLKTYPDAQAILLDHSKPMIQAAHKNIHAYSDRCDIIHADISNSIIKFAVPNSIDCIVSGFAIHHLPHEKKKELYKEIYNLLTDGGIFINIEHTASETPEVERLYDSLFIEHLAIHNKRERQDVSTEYHSRPDIEDNKLERVDIQGNWF